MPDDPQKNPMEAEFESAVSAPRTEAPPQPGLGGDVDFLTALQRPGANLNHPFGADLLKILAQVGAGAPGGLAGMGINAAQLAVNPKSLRPLLSKNTGIGTGNAAELASGALPALLRAIPGVSSAAAQFPKLFGTLTGAAGGAGVAAGDVSDRGGDWRTAGKLGAAGGGILGVAGAQMHGMTQKLPSPQAEEINRQLSEISGAPADAVARSRQASTLLNTLTAAPIEQKAAQAAERAAQEQGTLSNVFTRLADRFRPTVKGAQTTAAEAKARFNNAGTLTGIAENSDIDAAKDFLRLDYRKQLFDLQKAQQELESKYQGNSRNLPWYKNRSQTIADQLAELNGKKDQALELTRRTEAAASKASTSTLNAEAQGSDLAKQARAAEMAAKKNATRLGALESAATGAEVAATKADVQRQVAETKLSDIFTTAGVDPTLLSPEAQRFLNKTESQHGSMTLHDGLEIGLKNPEHMAGFRDTLELHDPKMLAAARGSFLYDVFEGARTGKGGKGAYPHIFDGPALKDRVDKLPTASVNELFGSPTAHNDLKELAQAAYDATKLADFHKVAGGIGSIGTTALGGIAMHSMGRSVTDPTVAATLVATAAGTLALVNIPKMIEASVQSDGIMGHLLTQYIKSKNPEKLPAAVTAALSKFITPVKYKTAGESQKSQKQRYDVY